MSVITKNIISLATMFGLTAGLIAGDKIPEDAIHPITGIRPTPACFTAVVEPNPASIASCVASQYGFTPSSVGSVVVGGAVHGSSVVLNNTAQTTANTMGGAMEALYARGGFNINGFSGGGFTR